MAERCAVGIDLGGTNIKAALVDDRGRLLASEQRRTPVQGGPDAVIGAMVGMVERLMRQAGSREVLGIGLGIPGLHDRQRGINLWSPNLHWQNVQVLEPFRRAFSLFVDMDNDVRVGALGELHFGAGRGHRNFLFIALGTGIGSGIVLDGQIYRGANGYGGEFGHMVIRPGGPLCGCGLHGCIEALASGRAIARRAHEAGMPADVRAAEVASAAAAGDPVALRVLQEVGEDLGRAIAIYTNVMDPEVVVVGGGAALAGDLLLEPTRQAARQYLLGVHRDRLRIVPALLGDESGAVGAATLVPGLV